MVGTTSSSSWNTLGVDSFGTYNVSSHPLPQLVAIVFVFKDFLLAASFSDDESIEREMERDISNKQG